MAATLAVAIVSGATTGISTGRHNLSPTLRGERNPSGQVDDLAVLPDRTSNGRARRCDGGGSFSDEGPPRSWTDVRGNDVPFGTGRESRCAMDVPWKQKRGPASLSVTPSDLLFLSRDGGT